MKTFKISVVAGILVLVCYSFYSFNSSKILFHKVDLEKQSLKFYWKDHNGRVFKNFDKLKKWLSSNDEQLIFAMNAGMYKKDNAPLGLYIEDGKTLSKLVKKQAGYGNFYMQPNGVFYITDSNKAGICKTMDFKNEGVKYATQSGPMLLIEGAIHPRFMEGSKNLNIRNGVGILPNGSLLFAMSEYKINFYDFASYFKSHGCKNALYLDGFVSKTYLPKSGYKSLNGNFGVIIGEVE